MKQPEIMADLNKLLHGRPLTEEEREAHEEAGESFHVPTIIHRSGGVSAKVLNACGICGAQITPGETGGWIALTDSQVDAIRSRKAGR